MTFLAPWAGWFLAGIPLIVALYLLKLQRRALTVSTLMFWHRLMQENRRRSLFGRLRNVLSLLLHLLIFLLIVAALAKPTFGRFTADGSSTVLIIDARARMQALEPEGTTRFELARRRAESYARHASASGQIALLVAGATAKVALGFAGDEKPLRAAIHQLTPTDAGGSLDGAIGLAEQLLESRAGARRIVVLTDRAPRGEASNPTSGQSAGAEAMTSAKEQRASIPVEFIGLGTARDNVAITQFATRENLTSSDTCEILLELRNFSHDPKSVDVEFALDGVFIDVKPFALPPSERKTELFSAVPRPSSGARGWFTARIDASDALAVDDLAFAVIPRKEPARVLLVTKGNWFLEKLLAADHQIEFELIAPDAFALPMADQFDAVVCDNVVPPGFAMESGTGNYFFVRTAPFAHTGEAIEQPLITDTDAQHPLLRLVDWRHVTILRARKLSMPPSDNGWRWDAPARSFDHPLLLAGTRRTATGDQRMVVLGFDVAESDLPLRVAFPLLISNALHWLSNRTPGVAPSLRAGQPMPLRSGEKVSVAPQTNRVSAPTPISRGEQAGDLFVPETNGFYLRTDPGGGERWVAVNTFDPNESDLRQENASANAPPAFHPMPSIPWAGHWPPWQYLAMAAIALSALEWWLFHRRRTE